MHAHYQALKARVEVHPNLNGIVHDSVRLSKGEPVRANYVILYPGGPDLDDARVMKAQDMQATATYEYDVKVVAVDANGAILLADAVMTQLVGAKLAVPGRKLDPIVLEECDQVQPETNVQDPLFYVDMLFSVVSRRG